MEKENKRFRFWKILSPLYFICFFLILFLAYGFPPDFKTWRFNFSDFILIAIGFTLPIALVCALFINWLLNRIHKKEKREIIFSKGDIFSLTAFILVVLSIFLIFFFEFFFPIIVISVIFGVGAIICGIIGFKKSEDKILSIISLFLEIIFLILFLISIPSPSRTKAMDARRHSDLHQLFIVQQEYYKKHGKYFGIPGCTSGPDCYPNSINDLFPTTPKDPLNEEPYVYKGLNNDENDQKFCYYAKLTDGRFFTASHNGNFYKKKEPISLDDCGSAD